MLKKFTVRRTGFQSTIAIGDCFHQNGCCWIIIFIGQVKKDPFLSNQTLIIEILAQQEGTFENMPTNLQLTPTEVRYSQVTNRKISSPGHLIVVGKGVAFQLTGIQSIRYEFIDCLVTYESVMIPEWPLCQLEKAVKKNRKAQFTVIS